VCLMKCVLSSDLMGGVLAGCAAIRIECIPVTYRIVHVPPTSPSVLGGVNANKGDTTEDAIAQLNRIVMQLIAHAHHRPLCITQLPLAAACEPRAVCLASASPPLLHHPISPSPTAHHSSPGRPPSRLSPSCLVFSSPSLRPRL